MKKLENISVSDAQIQNYVQTQDSNQFYQHPFRTAFSRVTTIAGSTIAPFKIPETFSKSFISSNGHWKYSTLRAGIQYACDNTNDLGVIALGFTYIHSYPEARKMLWHYLTGNGEEVEVNTERVLSEDNYLKIFVFESINYDIQKGKNSGSINFHQGLYTNDNWKNAFGSINIKWLQFDTEVDMWIEDTYGWHPNEQRTTQCVHQAMSKAKTYGAKEFKYHGTIFEIDYSKLTKALGK